MIEATLDHIEQGIAVFDKSSGLVGWNQRLGEFLAVPVIAVRLGVNARTYVEHIRRMADPSDVADRLAAWIENSDTRAPLDLEFTRWPDLILRLNARHARRRFRHVVHRHDRRAAGGA